MAVSEECWVFSVSLFSFSFFSPYFLFLLGKVFVGFTNWVSWIFQRMEMEIVGFFFEVDALGFLG